MAGAGTWLVALAGPVVRQALVSIGVGTITFVGLQSAVTSALNGAKSAVGGMPADIASIVAMAGIFTALSILAGGVMAGVSLMILKRFAKLS